jgi:hypothetical protein
LEAEKKVMTLAEEFHQACLEGYEEGKRELGYNATYFLRMVYEHGGVQAAKLLLNSQSVPEGLMTLWEHGRLDMSLENSVLHPKWHSLFTEDERKIARKRLEQLGYKPKF